MTALIGWCLLCFAMCLTVVIDTLLPGGPRLATAVWIIPMIAIIPTGMATMKVVKGSFFRWLGPRESVTLLRPLPMLVQVAVLALLLAALVSNVLFFASDRPKGQLLATDDGYVMVDGGQRTPVSRQEYLRAEAARRRLFALDGMSAHGWSAAAIAAAYLRRRRGEQREERPWPFSESRMGDPLRRQP